MTLFVGFIAAAIAAIGFGSNFVPVKKYDMGDGMMFQMIMPLGIWIVGLIYEIIQGCEPNHQLFFHPFALLGGVIWALGNILTVPIIKMIGMALGLAIWSATSIVVGWITGKFGILGTPKDHSVTIPWLNYVGIAIIMLSLVLFFRVTPSNREQDDEHTGIPRNPSYIFNPQIGHLESPAVVDKRDALINRTSDLLARKELEIEIEITQSWVDRLTAKQQEIVGIILSILAGICYGLVFCPIQYLIEQHKHDTSYPSKLEDYAFTHYCGILLTTIIFFIIYAIRMKNDPQVNHEGVLPAIIAGLAWGIAQTAFFITQDPANLGTTTSFPIVAGSPQIVASLWGVFAFQEVTGGKALCTLACAIAVGVIGVTCIGLSKV